MRGACYAPLFCNHLDGTLDEMGTPVPNVTVKDMYGGSGLSESSATGGDGSGTMSQRTNDGIQPIFEQIFPHEEDNGQLYSYRESRSSAILRTRWSIYEDEGINISIGVKPNTADGVYRCFAANVLIPNVTDNRSVRIIVRKGEKITIIMVDLIKKCCY